ncbi:MAG: MCP four helix bundle domain-containing protein [Chloroflexi bacterium]|nr:MCP four helix bundle domain-containing protein [Chloroflexota bacterium]
MSFGIRPKLMAGFGAVLLMLAIVGIIGYRNTSRFTSDFHTFYDDRFMPAIRLSKVQMGLFELRVNGLNYDLIDAAGRAQVKASDQKLVASIDEEIKAYAATTLVPAEVEGLAVWNRHYPAFLQMRQQAQALTDSGKPAEAAALRAGEGARLFSDTLGTITKLIDVQAKVGKEMNESMESAAALSQWLIIGFTLLAIGIGFGVAWFVASTVARGVESVSNTLNSLADKCLAWLADGLQNVAQGNLTVGVTPVTPPIEKFGSDELGQLAVTTNAMRTKIIACIGSYEESRAGLHEIVNAVRGAATTVSHTSQELGQATEQTSSAVQQVTQAVQNVASGAQETSQSAQMSSVAIEQLGQVIDNVAGGAQEQARQIQSASDTTNSMAERIGRVAGDAQSVASASQQMKASAQHGATAVRETVIGMQEIQTVVSEAASKVEELGRLGDRIGAVVETIDDIAEQTNLLALNAAIEAARAGEHGRGFAVVADEVRKLAERSQRETKAISELIVAVQAGTGDAVKAMTSGSTKVEQGTLRADQAGTALTEILSAVDSTVLQVEGIANAAQEMSRGAADVVQIMTSLSAVVEESSAATEEMAAQATQMTGAIQSIASVSEENSAATEQVSASAEEMSAQVEEMSAQAQDLATTAQRLTELVARFQLESTEADQRVQAAAPRRPQTMSALGGGRRARAS